MSGSRRSFGSLLVVVAAAACSSNPAPRGWLAPAGQAVLDPYGAWIEVRLASTERDTTLGGELIAVDADSVYMLAPDAGFLAIAQADVTRARVAFYDSQSSQLALWTTLGSLSTLSHGAGLIISLPVWLIAGPLATGAQSRAPLVNVQPEKRPWETVSVYARFPQGLPDELDRGRLTTKPPR